MKENLEAIVESIVLSELQNILGISKEKINLDLDLIDDYQLDDDDFMFVFVPNIAKKLGVNIPLDSWLKVYTARDIIEILIKLKCPINPE